MTLPQVRCVDREAIVYNDNEPTRVQTCVDDKSLSRRNQHRGKDLCWKGVGHKKVLWCLGIVPSKRCCQFSTIKPDCGRNSPLTEHRTSANRLFTLQTVAHAVHRVAIRLLHVRYHTHFLLVEVTLSWHNWKHYDFHYNGAYFIYYFCISHKCLLVIYSRHKKNTSIHRWYGTGITSLQSRSYISLVLRTQLI